MEREIARLLNAEDKIKVQELLDEYLEQHQVKTGELDSDTDNEGEDEGEGLSAPSAGSGNVSDIDPGDEQDRSLPTTSTTMYELSLIHI